MNYYLPPSAPNTPFRCLRSSRMGVHVGPEYAPRKESYLAGLATEPGSAKLVSCADKLHNISNTLRDIRGEGVKPWKDRMKKTKNGVSEKQCWYYLGCLEALSTGWSNPILDEFARAVVLLCELVGTGDDLTKARQLSGSE